MSLEECVIATDGGWAEVALNYGCSAVAPPGGDTPIAPPAPYCASGQDPWNRPLTNDATGAVVVAPVTTAASEGGRAGGPALQDFFNEARLRAASAARNGGARLDAFYWQTGLTELTAMILQIEPTLVRGDSLSSAAWKWRFVNMRGKSSERSRYWEFMPEPDGSSREVLTVVPGTLVAERHPVYTAEKVYRTSRASATRVTIASEVSVGSLLAEAGVTDPATATAADLRAGIYAKIGSALDTFDSPADLADYYFTPGPRWTSANLPAGSMLRRAYESATMRWPSQSSGAPVRLAVDVRIGTTWLGNIADLLARPIETTVRIDVYTPARKVLIGATTSSSLYDRLLEIVQRNLDRKDRVGDLPFDDYGPYTRKPENKYAFPVFHAPSTASSSAAVCGSPGFSITGVSPTLTIPAPTWTPGSFSGCPAVRIGSLSAYQSQMTKKSSCWLHWLIRDIPDPVLAWSDRFFEQLPDVEVRQSRAANVRISGTTNTPITLEMLRDTTGRISYRASDGPIEPIDRSITKKSFAVARSGTFYNFTQLGISAEVGTPGRGGFIVTGGRVARRSIAAPEYNLSLVFAQTPLERLQLRECRGRSAADLLRLCGIAYDATAKEWYYQVRIRTWYGGVYHAPDQDFRDDAQLRGFFNPVHTPGIRGTLVTTLNGVRYPDSSRIRSFSWPGDPGGSLQRSGIRFLPYRTGAGFTSPDFSTYLAGSWPAADRAYFEELRCLSLGNSSICGDPTPQPRRPAYTYSSGSFYPLFDSSGGAGGACASTGTTGSGCAVRVYVRSPQPQVDR
jgi:hypothetical protein